jgi:hypothetical protein
VIPILGALSLVAAALAAALEHVLDWMRRTLATIASPARITGIVVLSQPLADEFFPTAVAPAPLGARGPPGLS